MSIVSSSTEKLVRRFKGFIPTKSDEPSSTIHVDYIASKVASFYEKIRKILDYQEEHLFRKNAIDRILKRRLFIQQNSKNEIAYPLICELIRAGYLPNDAIPENKIEKVGLIIDKYLLLLDASAEINALQKEEILNWLISLASCEIEEKLAPPFKDEALSDYMYEVISEKIVLKNINFSQEEKETQIFIAVQKALLRADQALLSYRLVKWHYPEWTNPSQEFLSQMIPQLESLKEAVFKEISHPLGPKFFQITNRYNTPFLVLGDALLNNPDLVLQPEKLEGEITKAYQERYQHSKNKLRRAAIYSTASLFVTKILLALAIEVPFDLYVTHQLIPLNLSINIIFPPFLMFLIIMTIKPPAETNAQRVILEVMKIVYQNKKEETYEIKASTKKGWFLRGAINLFYLISFLISFGLIIWGLTKLNFSWLSIIIFLVFISLICFTGLKIRQQSKGLSVEKEKETGWLFIIDLFALPLVRVGQWLSHQWAKFNILIVVFNLILEVPFQIFVEFLENWHRFLKEKKEEIQ